jgi:hypothetical protein
VTADNRPEYEKRVNRVIDHIRDHLADELEAPSAGARGRRGSSSDCGATSVNRIARPAKQPGVVAGTLLENALRRSP